MGFLFNRRKPAQEERAFFPVTTASMYAPMQFAGENNPTVCACVNKIANTLSTLPIRLYAHTKGGGKTAAYSNPLFRVLEKPAYEESAVMFYHSLIRNILLNGNAYAYIGRNRNGDIVNLSIINSKRVLVQRDSSLRKTFHIDGETYTEREILHIPFPGTGYNGTIGISQIKLNRELIELDNNLLQYIRLYFNNSIGTRYALEMDKDILGNRTQELDKLYAAILPAVNKYITGAENAGKVMVPPPGAKFTKLEQTSNAQAQLDTLLKMVEKQIALCFNIPYEIIDSESSKYGSLEQKQQDFLSNCIKPLGMHICQCIEKLLPPEDTALFIEYDFKPMLTTDIKSTIDYLRQEVQSGLLTINEARAKLGEGPIEDIGDTFFIPANLAPLSKEYIDAYNAKSKILMAEASEPSGEHNIIGDDKI